MKIVETSKKTYLVKEVVEISGGMSQLNGAVVVDSCDDPSDMAEKALRAILLEQLKEVKVRTNTIESIEDAGGSVAKMIKKMEARVPEAKKRAEIKAILEELRDFDNNDDDD